VEADRELGAAFLCFDLQITGEPRAIAQYLASWLAVLKANKEGDLHRRLKASEAAAFRAALQTLPTRDPGMGAVPPSSTKTPRQPAPVATTIIGRFKVGGLLYWANQQGREGKTSTKRARR
jgi:hypothetical protein